MIGRPPWVFLGMILLSLAEMSRGQTIPMAPPEPTCSWDGSGTRSTCKFKDALAGTPTSVAGNRVIAFVRSSNGGYGESRKYLREAVHRLAARYGFSAVVTEDPAVFTSANLADVKVVIMGYGEGDVVPPGSNRVALENFQLVHGWGVLWIHSACAFISKGWPFGRESCVQQFHSHQPATTVRRMFIDTGTTASPNHGLRNPQSEFLLRDLPGWGGKRVLAMQDEWYCFQAPVRDSAGVNVLFGYDRSSGFPDRRCPERTDSTESGSQNHNMVWTHKMGDGITLFNSWGHTESMYTGYGNMGDSLLWRFIRYAAKDWCVSGSGEPGCDHPVRVRPSEGGPRTYPLHRNGMLSMPLPDAGRFSASVHDLAGRAVYSGTVDGPGKLEVPGLRRGRYQVRVRGKAYSRTHRIMVY